MTKKNLASPIEGAHAVRCLSALPWLLAAGLLAFAPAALADARSDAKRHYRQGMELISQGRVEQAIEEFKSAYAIKPHPDALYNIARAYLDLGNIPEALNYFRRYSANDPEDRYQVEGIMQRLQAALGTQKKAEEKKAEEATATAEGDKPAQPAQSVG